MGAHFLQVQVCPGPLGSGGWRLGLYVPPFPGRLSLSVVMELTVCISLQAAPLYSYPDYPVEDVPVDG